MNYQFEEFQLDTETLELRCSGQLIALEPQVFSLLELLITNYDRVVSKDEINQRVWGGRIVTDAAVNSRIRSLRIALNDDGKRQRVIRTIRDRGFRFVAQVTSTRAPQSHLPPPNSRLERHAMDQQQQENFALGDHSTLSTDTSGDVQSEPQASTKPSIAVLPFTLLSLDSQFEPLADAIAHEVIADLSRLSWLHVISRASTFKLRSQAINTQSAAHLFAVDYIVTGTLTLFGKQATVTVELISSTNDEQIWAENIDCSLDELIDIRRQIATRIANAVEQRIQTQQALNSEHISTENLDAWMAYFRGLRHAYRFNSHDNDIASHLFEQAIQLDNQFSLAHAGLSFTHFQNAFVGYTKDIESSQKLSLANAERAFELDQLDPVANLMMGRAKYLNGEWQQAGPWFERCATLSPNNALAYYHQALNHVIGGEVSEVESLSTQALSLSPIDPLQYAFLTTKALANLTMGNHEMAEYWGEQAANAPLAHHLIDVVCAITHDNAGSSEKAEYRRKRIRQRAPNFNADQFFRSLPFVDKNVRTLMNRSLNKLGLA